MSDQDDKAREEAIHDAESTSHPDRLPNEEKDAVIGSVMIFFMAGLIVSLLIGWVLFPKLLYSKKQQPVDFNHALHNEMVDGCESCHYFREDGSYAGVPKLAQCIDCHEEIQGVSRDEEIFVNDYVAKNREVPWLIYSKQPDCVFFSHAAHVKMAKIDCQVCHGDIGESTHLRVYQENRISGYSRDIWGHNIAGFKRHTWDRMKMDDCAECHESAKMKKTSVQTQKDACFVCHK